LQGEFSDQGTELRFMMPAIAQPEAALAATGSERHRVVLYSIGTAMWATRFWWMLRSLGSKAYRAGWWARQMEGGGPRRRNRTCEGYPPATFTAKPQHGYFVDKHQAACCER